MSARREIRLRRQAQFYFCLSLAALLLFSVGVVCLEIGRKLGHPAYFAASVVFCGVTLALSLFWQNRWKRYTRMAADEKWWLYRNITRPYGDC